MKEEMKPIEISNTDRACEVLHGIDFTNVADMITAIARVEVLFDTITTLRSRVKELEESKWISVEDRLPEKKGLYLCYDVNIQTRYQKSSVYLFDDYNSSWYDSIDGVHPTHWQPLPQKPTL